MDCFVPFNSNQILSCMRPAKILVIEDDQLIGKQLVKNLEKEGYIVTNLVTNKKDAIQAFERDVPDLMIADIELASNTGRAKDTYGGVDLVHTITSRYNNIPCLYYTGHGNKKEFIQKANNSNHTGIVIKTAPFLQVKIAIESILQKHWEIQKSISLPDYFYIEGYTVFKTMKRKVGCRVIATDIVFVKYVNNGVQLFSEGTKDKLFRKNLQLTTFFKRYPYPFFLRISQDKIINIDRVKYFVPETDEIVLMHNGEEYYLSLTQSYRREFIALYNQRRIKSQ